MPPRADNEFGALDGVRTPSMLWVLLLYTMALALEGPGYTNVIGVMPVEGRGLLSRWVGDMMWVQYSMLQRVVAIYLEGWAC